ncbi:MAG: PHP domain-containing protein, partial [Actinobacteria bacterium]|nr:PHP domain-containing protein [Actinomycetota bacterium]
MPRRGRWQAVVEGHPAETRLRARSPCRPADRRSRTRRPRSWARASWRASMSYVELHCHSAYSFLDGASHPEELVVRAGELGYPALALTDHDGVY